MRYGKDLWKLQKKKEKTQVLRGGIRFGRRRAVNTRRKIGELDIFSRNICPDSPGRSTNNDGETNVVGGV